MKKVLCAIALSGALALAGHAQDASDSTAQQKTIQMTGVRAWLSKGVDAKKAKEGDPVQAKVQDKVKLADSQELPRNTVLIGHIDRVQPSANKGDSTVEVTFDKAQLKGGQELPVKATIMQIAPPVNTLGGDQAGSGGSAPVAMPSSPAPSASSSGGSSGGSAPAPSAPSQASVTPMSDDTQQQQPTMQSVAGVTLNSDIHQQNSGTFLAKGKNVHLPEGMQMQLALAVVPANTHIQ